MFNVSWQKLWKVINISSVVLCTLYCLYVEVKKSSAAIWWTAGRTWTGNRCWGILGDLKDVAVYQALMKDTIQVHYGKCRIQCFGSRSQEISASAAQTVFDLFLTTAPTSLKCKNPFTRVQWPTFQPKPHVCKHSSSYFSRQNKNVQRF